MPRLVVLENDFRIVEGEVGGDILHTLEVREGIDAMGVEKWRTFKTDSTQLRAIFGYLIRLALELETMKREHQHRIPEQISESRRSA